MKKGLTLVVVLIIAAAGWFFLSPLFIDQVVDEEFLAVLPTRDEVASMSASERESARDKVMEMMADKPDVTVTEESGMPAQPQLLGRGAFRDGDAIHKGQGDALLYQLDTGQQLLRLENLNVTNGPALVVYLAKHPDPTTAEQVKTDGFVSLGELKGNRGNQNYPIPTDVDVTQFNSVVIWCELFDVLFSPAPLSAG